LKDIASWSGVPADTLASVLPHMDLGRFRSTQGEVFLDLPGAPLPNGDTPAPVRFLPTWDATLLVHARRTGILPEAYRKIIFHVTKPQSMQTFLVDGHVAGAWKEEHGKIVLNPFERISKTMRVALTEEGHRMLQLYLPKDSDPSRGSAVVFR
jgi:hypothetical protein